MNDASFEYSPHGEDVDRLVSYLIDEQLDEKQFAELESQLCSSNNAVQSYRDHITLHSLLMLMQGYEHLGLLSSESSSAEVSDGVKAAIARMVEQTRQNALTDPDISRSRPELSMPENCVSAASEGSSEETARAANAEFNVNLAANALPVTPARQESRHVWTLGRVKRPRMFSMAVAAVALIVVIATMAYLHSPPRAPRPELAPAEPQAAIVAHLAASIDCQWEQKELSPGSPLRRGQALALRKGIAKLDFIGGVQMVIEAPARFTIDAANAVSLRRGRAIAHVPPHAQGFTMHTLAADAIDLGTQFGVNVDDVRSAEVHVFDGQIEVRYGKEKGQALQMSEGKGMRFTGGSQTAEQLAVDREGFLELLARIDTPGFERWRAFSQELRREADLLAYYNFEPQRDAPRWSAEFQRADQNARHTYRGDSPKNVWNILALSGATTDPVFDNLQDNSGAATEVSLAFTGKLSADHGFTDVNGPRANNPIGVDYLLWGVTRWNLDNVIGFRFSGLTPGASYELTAFGGSSGIDRSFNMRVDTNGDGDLSDETALIVPNEADAGASDGPPSHFPPSVTFIATASPSGTILGNAARIGNNEANWAGFQLRSVPALRNEAADARLDGEIRGARWTAGRWPRKNALAFAGPGSDQFVALRGEAVDEQWNANGSFAVATWFQVDSFTAAWQTLVSSGDSSWRIHRFQESDALSFDMAGKSLSSRAPVNDGRWHHLVAVYDADGAAPRIRFYIDGALESAGEIDPHTAARNNSGPLLIGKDSERPGREFHGRIDELSLFRRALADEEVRRMYEAGNPYSSSP